MLLADGKSPLDERQGFLKALLAQIERCEIVEDGGNMRILCPIVFFSKGKRLLDDSLRFFKITLLIECGRFLVEPLPFAAFRCCCWKSTPKCKRNKENERCRNNSAFA